VPHAAVGFFGEFFVVLLYAVVGEVTKQISEFRRIVCINSESEIEFLEDVRLQWFKAFNHNPLTNIKLLLINNKRVLYVFLNY
jgi:hypothetical protein